MPTMLEGLVRTSLNLLQGKFSNYEYETCIDGIKEVEENLLNRMSYEGDLTLFFY